MNQQNQNNNQQSSMADDGGAPTGADAEDITGVGGGNIGVGTPQTPGQGGNVAPNTQPPRPTEQ